MPKKQPMTVTDWGVRVNVTRRAVQELRTVRFQLADVGANQAAKAVARALKSVEGAERHALGHYNRAQEVAK